MSICFRSRVKVLYTFLISLALLLTACGGGGGDSSSGGGSESIYAGTYTGTETYTLSTTVHGVPNQTEPPPLTVVVASYGDVVITDSEGIQYSGRITQAIVSYMVEPGEYPFMAIGESADFKSAELEANKIYFVLVTPRMGAWKARFSLKPIHADELNSQQFQEWIDVSKWVEKSPDSYNLQVII